MQTIRNTLLYDLKCGLRSTAFHLASEIDPHERVWLREQFFHIRAEWESYTASIDLRSFILPDAYPSVGVLAGLAVLTASTGFPSTHVVDFIALLTDRGVSFDGVLIKSNGDRLTVPKYIRELVVAKYLRVTPLVARILGLTRTTDFDDTIFAYTIHKARRRDAPLVLYANKKWKRFFDTDGDRALWRIISSLF